MEQFIHTGTKVFASKEYATVSSRPKLTIVYTIGSAATPTTTRTATPTLTPTPLSGSDSFNSGTLGAGWSWIREDNTKWTLTANPGYMRIITQSGDTYGAGGNMKNILLQTPPTSDFTVITKLSFSPTTNWHQAGMVVYMDDDNNVMLNRIYNGGNKFSFKKEISGATTETTVTDTLGGTVYLKIVKSSASYSGYYSADGTTWTQIGSTLTGVSFSSPKAGLFSANGGASPANINADFDYFNYQ